MGGVKRPAEGSKEEPSEKKNHPVVAKIFEPKKAMEKSSVHSACPSSNAERPAAEVSAHMMVTFEMTFCYQRWHSAQNMKEKQAKILIQASQTGTCLYCFQSLLSIK